jgi:hypothetical protein
MTPFLLHPNRADVLAACALMMRAREPLADGLERLAAGDALLAPWARRLAPGLREGEPVAHALRRLRLVSAREAELLALDHDLPAALDRVAGAAAAPPPRAWLVRHLPITFALALFTPDLAMTLLSSIAGGPFASIYRELGVQLPLASELLTNPARLLVSSSVVIAVLASSEWLVRNLRGLRHIAHLWCVEVERESALLRLVQAARLGDDRGPRGTLLQLVLDAMRLSAVRLRRPRWDRDWRTWLFLTRFRLTRETRRAAAARPDLAGRLLLLGVVDERDGRPQWVEAEERCRARLDSAIEESLRVARPALLLVAWSSALTSGTATLIPLFMIIRELGRAM